MDSRFGVDALHSIRLESATGYVERVIQKAVGKTVMGQLHTREILPLTGRGIEAFSTSGFCRVYKKRPQPAIVLLHPIQAVAQ